MADFHINSVNTTVRTTDSQSLLNQQVLDRIVQAVLERLQSEKDHQKRDEADRRWRAGVFSGSPRESCK